MAYALRPGLHCCTVEGQTLCLDVAENGYFSLNAEAGNIVQRLADGEIQPIEDQQRLSTLVEKGILIEIAGDSEWRPPFCQPNADMDPVAGSAHVTELILAVAAQLHAEWQIRQRPLAQILDSFTKRKSASRTSLDTGQAARLRRQIAGFGAANLLLGSTDRCLATSLAFASLCLRRGFPASLIFGVRTGPFTAHCWVQHHDIVLNDNIERVRLYTPILAL